MMDVVLLRDGVPRGWVPTCESDRDVFQLAEYGSPDQVWLHFRVRLSSSLHNPMAFGMGIMKLDRGPAPPSTPPLPVMRSMIHFDVAGVPLK